MWQLFTSKKLISISFLLLILIGSSSCNSSRKSIAVEDGWELISESKVNFVRDKDEVMITSPNQFTALRFRVEDRDVRINELKVYFQNGDKLEPNVDEVINADHYSKDIELASEGRQINKIEFTYRTTGNILKGRANVLVFGKKY